jgi:hypothetical protein
MMHAVVSHHRRVRHIARIVGVTAAVAALAATPASAEWTFAGFLGGARTHTTSLTISQPSQSTHVTFHPVRYRSESLDSPLYYGYRAGYFPKSGWLGLEGELIHLKVVADTTRTTRVDGTLQGAQVAAPVVLSSIVEQFSITHGVNLLLVNAVLRWRPRLDQEGASRWTIAARVGAGGSIPHAESQIDGRFHEGCEWGSLSLQGAAGVQLRLQKHLSLLGEYKLTRSVQHVRIADGTARTPLTTHHLTAGLVVSLGATRPR